MFLHPHLLGLLLLPALLAVYQLRQPATITGHHRVTATGLRWLALSLVILALARPFQRSRETTRRVVAVIDCSPSMGEGDMEQVASELAAQAAQAGRDNVRVVIFGASAQEIAFDDDLLSAAGLAKLRFSGAGSAVAEALELASTLCPDNANGDIHLFSDGRETRGDMRGAAAELGRRGLHLTTHDLGTRMTATVLLCQVHAPAEAAVGEAVALTVEIESLGPGEATLTVTNDKGETVGGRTVPLRAGLQGVALVVRPDQTGLQHYQISQDRGGQTVSAALNVSRTVVGVLETAPAGPAASVLGGVLGRNAEIVPLAPADLTDHGLARIDVLVLADTPAAELPLELQQNLRTWVENGGGLLVTGGRNAFGPGGYARSELAAMLPLRFPQKKEVRDPSTALAVIIDTSGSMGAEGVNLAKEVARLALKRLKPHDKAGIVEFHGAKRWAAPMQPASNGIAIQRALNRLSAGGGTVMMPAIEEAYYGLLNVRTRTRHVLVLTDGGVEQGAFESLLRRMADDGIHVSTVLVGPRAGGTFMTQLATWGQGQCYTAPNRFKLPEVIVKQPSSSLLNPFVETEMGLKPVLSSRLTRDLTLADAPMLHGYVKTEPKDTAELLLQSEIGDPVLARWHYGLGRVAILTTQLGGEWAEAFLNWQEAPTMMANLVRQLRGVSPCQSLDVGMTWSSAGLAFDIRDLSLTPALAAAALRIEIRDDSGARVAQRDIMPVRAHLWRALVEDLPAGDLVVEVKGAAGEGVLAATALQVPPQEEFNRMAPDRERLAAAAGIAGEFAARADGVAAPVRPREWWPLCAALGLLSFILMILVRRLPDLWATTVRSKRATAAAVALLVVLGGLGATPSARAQELEEAGGLTPLEQQRIDACLALEPDDARQALKGHCREIAQHYGDLKPLCDYLVSKADDLRSQPLLVVAAMADGNLDLARKTLLGLIEQPDPTTWMLSEMARLEGMGGDPNRALWTLEAALDKCTDPGMRFAMHARKAQLLYDSSRRDAARTAIRDILAEADFDRPEARNYFARIAGLHGDYTLVEELFTPMGEGRALMRDRLYLGQILMHLEKPAKAREQFAGALTLSRLHRDLRYALDRIVSAARAADELPALIDEWLAAEHITPEQLEILVGVLGGELGRAGDVLKLLEREDLPAGTQKLLQSSAFQERVIMLAQEMGKSELARQTYRDLIALHPKEYAYQNGYAKLLLMDGDREEAEALFRKAIAETDSGGGLMGLAASARSMALEEVAMEAAVKAGGMGELAHVQALLFEAELYRQQGEVDKTLAVLQALEQEIGEDAELMIPLSEAYERHGYKNDALRLLRKAYDLDPNERLLKRLIALLEVDQQSGQLSALWRQLWETATEPMAIIQARDRLLDLGSRNGTLADMAIELEERVDQHRTLSDRELAMLLEIYTSVNDPVSAADILMELSRQQGGDKLEGYRRMAQVYMECELFGRCNAVLRKLIKLDPENRDDYLQTLALIALERKNDGDAVAVLSELATRSPDGVLRDSFSASVLNMIGKHPEAARIYRRCLADDPDEIEAWLLWGNALKSEDAQAAKGRGARRTAGPPAGPGHDQASGMFCVLLEDAADNDLFTVAVDGLLNIGASRNVLCSALHRVNERIALQPDKMFLYRLAADLHEELRQSAAVRMILEQALVVAEDGRSIILRELVALAKEARDQGDVIRYGRSLLNTADHLPPTECMELGIKLLGKGQFSEADSAFQRVLADGDAMGVTRDIILSYENAGLYGKAGKLLRELLISNPFDVDLLLRLGVIEEKEADFVAAGKAYQRALDLMIGRMPRVSLKRDVEKDTSRHRYHRSYNLDEVRQYFELASQGLIVSARTSASRRELLDTLQKQVQAEVKGLEASSAFGKSYAENPRLVHLAGLMRRAGMAFHQSEYFDPMDDDLLRRYPADEGLMETLQGERRKSGLMRNAYDFCERNNGITSPLLRLSRHLDDRKRVAKILTEPSEPNSQAITLLPLLSMCGYDDLFDAVLAGSELRALSTAIASPLTAAGMAADRPELVREVLFNVLASQRGTRSHTVAEQVQRLIMAAWPVLSEADRSSAVNQYALVFEKVSTYYQRALVSYQHYLMCQVGRSQEIDPNVLRNYLKGDINARYPESYTWGAVKGWLLAKPPADRSGALRQLIAPLKPDERVAALLQFAMLLEDEEIDDEFVKVFAEFFPTRASAVPATKALQLALSGYRPNRLESVIRKVVRSDSAGPLPLPLALACRRVGEDAAVLSSQFKGAISSVKAKSGSDIRSVLQMYGADLRQAAEVLPPEQLDPIVERYVGSSDPVDMVIAFLLFRYAGRDVEALSILHRIEALSPENPRAGSARAVMPVLLARFGWDAYSPGFLGDGADDRDAYTRLRFLLHDALALLAGSSDDALDAGARRMHAGKLMKDPMQFVQSTRIYWADSRHPGVTGSTRSRYQMRTWPGRMTADPGGLLGTHSPGAGTTLDDLRGVSGSQDELSYWLSAMPVEGHAYQSPACRALAGNVAEQGLSRWLREELAAASGHSLLNHTDIQTITAIAGQAPEEIPDAVAGPMSQVIFASMSSGSEQIAALSKACKALGIKNFAQSLGRWSVVRDAQAKGTSAWLADYLEVLPEENRRDALKNLIPYMGIHGGRPDPCGDEASLFAALLDNGMRAEATEMLARYLVRFRLGGLPSASVRDAAAVALARLERPDDYRDVLAQQTLLELAGSAKPRQVISVMRDGTRHYGDSGSNSMSPGNHTGALPEPAQVAQVERYLDIYQEVYAWLRGIGRLSRENYVAQLCMVGEWCVARGLMGRAGELLALAESESDGMLTGRLWLADLHRLLGQEEQAAAIERELLRHDLLPLPRVPAALQRVAAGEGQLQADAIAYRIASYSNHPVVLPLALRHARSQGLKEETRDLDERLRKVSTLFLPQKRD